MYILNIETATKNCSVAISNATQTLHCIEMAEQSFTHSEKLHVFIQQLLEQANLNFKDLSAVAISMGPGSYTGLRIGTSTAKGLCFALDIPLIAINTLAILTEQVTVDSGFIVPMLDARRMEVYTQTFTHDKSILSEVKPLVVDHDPFTDLNAEIYFIGDGASKCKAVLQQPNYHFLDQVIYPSAKDMGRLAYEKFQQQAFEDIAYFEPFYLKEFFTGK